MATLDFPNDPWKKNLLALKIFLITPKEAANHRRFFRAPQLRCFFFGLSLSFTHPSQTRNFFAASLDFQLAIYNIYKE
jgi:hypothetical protein